MTTLRAMQLALVAASTMFPADAQVDAVSVPEPNPWIVHQYPQVGVQDYLIVVVRFREDECSMGQCPTAPGNPISYLISQSELDTLENNLEQELSVVSYGQLTVNVSQAQVQLEQSSKYYRSYATNSTEACCPTESNLTRPFAELQHQVRNNLLDQSPPVDPNNFDRVIYVVAKQFYGGVGGTGTINQRDLIADLVDLRDNRSAPACLWHFHVLHELGHTWGFQHANLFDPNCAGPGSSGNWQNQGDTFDPMGLAIDPSPPSCAPPGANPRGRHWFNPWFANRAGWIPDTDVAVAPQGMSVSTFEIQPLEYGPNHVGYTAVKIPVNDNTSAWVYWRRYLATEPNLAGHGAGVLVSFEGNSNISPAYLVEAGTQSSQPCSWALDYAPLLPEQTYALRVPGSATPVATLANLGIQSNGNVMVAVLDAPATTEAPHIRRNHSEFPSGRISGEFTYDFDAYLPQLGTNGLDIAEVKMRLFEFTDHAMNASYGWPGCQPTCAQAPPGHVFPAPFLPCTPITQLPCTTTAKQLCAPAGPIIWCTPEIVGTPTPLTSPPYQLSVQTANYNNGIYYLFVEATSVGGQRTVVYWPHLIFNP